jgi:hypothetical protein
MAPGLARAGAIALAVLVALGAVVGLVAFLASRDSGPVHHSAPSGPGQPVAAGAPAGLSPGLRDSLRRGDVLLAYASPAPPPGLAALANAVQGGPPDPALAAAGQAVLVVRLPGTAGIVGLAWRRRQPATSASDPALRRFAEYWLGRGAG